MVLQLACWISYNKHQINKISLHNTKYQTIKNRSIFQFVPRNILDRIGAGAERAKNLVSGSGAVSGCEKNWLEREREVAERGTERGSGIAEKGLSGERKFGRSRSAHMLWSLWSGHST